MLPGSGSSKSSRTGGKSSNPVLRKWRLFATRYNLTTPKLTVGIIALFAVLYIYKLLLFKHGTIAPPATIYYTKPYNGLEADDYPSPGWKPNFRVVVTMTTTPNRLDKVQESIDSLMSQTLLPTVIYLNVPKGPMKRHPERSYEEVEIPPILQSYEIVVVNRCVDYGPATKLIPALQHETEPDALIITLDDDQLYPPRLIEALAWEAEHHTDDAIGVCGWGMMPIPNFSIGIVPVYVPYFLRPTGRRVDILQACCGNAYRRRFFTDLAVLENIPAICITVDDVWIAGVLAIFENHSRVIISKRLDPDDPSWKGAESKSSRKKMKLSEYNDANEIHYKCVVEMESLFGSPWKRVYQS